MATILEMVRTVKDPRLPRPRPSDDDGRDDRTRPTEADREEAFRAVELADWDDDRRREADRQEEAERFRRGWYA